MILNPRKNIKATSKLVVSKSENAMVEMVDSQEFGWS